MIERSQRKLLLFSVVAATLLILAAVYWEREVVAQREFRAKISGLLGAASQRQLDEASMRLLIQEPRFSGLRVHNNSSTDWQIEAPSSFGAQNWVLYVEFKNSRVSAIRVRSADSKLVRPPEAPPDKVFE